VWEIVANVVLLRREVVALGLAFLPDQFRLLVGLVHVMGNRPHVVEELRIDRPATVLLPDVFPHNRSPTVLDRLAQGEAFLAHHAVAQSLVGNAPLVGGLGCRPEPAFVDPAAVGAIGVRIVRVQFDPQSGLKE